MTYTLEQAAELAYKFGRVYAHRGRNLFFTSEELAAMLNAAQATPQSELTRSEKMRVAGFTRRPSVKAAIQAEERLDKLADHTALLREALAALILSRPYVEGDSQRMYDGTNGHGIRKEATRRLEVLDAVAMNITKALEATP